MTEKTENLLPAYAHDQIGLVDHAIVQDLALQLEISNNKLAAINKAYGEALNRSMVRLLMKNKVKEELLSGKHDSGLNKFSEWAKNETEMEPVRFITLSLPQYKKKEITERIAFWNDYLSTRKWLRKASWCWEQRGETDASYLTGIHIHLVTPVSKKPPGEIIRDISVQTKLEKQFIDIKNRTAGHCFNYLLTEKKPEYKKLRQKYDEKFRDEFKIEKICTK